MKDTFINSIGQTLVTGDDVVYITVSTGWVRSTLGKFVGVNDNGRVIVSYEETVTCKFLINTDEPFNEAEYRKKNPMPEISYPWMADQWKAYDEARNKWKREYDLYVRENTYTKDVVITRKTRLQCNRVYKVSV